MLNDTYKLLASVTVVRELYDSEKSLYDVLEKFINEIIYRNKLYSFTAKNITDFLNKEYSFKLNESIVKTCLKRMKFVKKNGTYNCNDLAKRGSQVDSFFEESTKKNEKLFKQLFDFLENRQGKLTELDKNRIRNNFCDFLLQDSVGRDDSLTQFFHEFILSIEDDSNEMEILNAVKEGTLLYEGLRYCSISESGSWKTNMNIILDTEILFAIGGYNSEMYQDLYLELEKYLKEINRDCPSRNPRIQLSYFEETKNELDAYFESAERIVKQKDVLDPTKEAMQQIVNNCTKPSDVQAKKAIFFQKLREKNIHVVEHKFYDLEKSENVEYNREQKELIEKYTMEWKETSENIHRSLQCLSHVNILRNGKSNNGFEQCGFIFLTATGRTLKLANTPELSGEGKVPLATTLDFLINRFWFKLNKGFGSNQIPRTLDMVMRSRHILASILNSKVAKNFDELKGKYENGDISKEEFVAMNSDLRHQLKTPDEVDKDTIGEVIDDLEQWNLEKAIEEQKRKDAQLKEAQGENKKLKEILEKYENMHLEQQKELAATQKNLDTVNTNYENDKEQWNLRFELAEKNNRENVEAMNKMQMELAEIRKRDKWFKYRFFQIIVLIIVLARAGVFVYGEIQGYIWAKVVSAMIEISVLIPVINVFFKKKRPK